MCVSVIVVVVVVFSSGTHWLILRGGKQKQQCELSNCVYFLSFLSLSHTVATELGSMFGPFMKVPILWDGVGGVGWGGMTVRAGHFSFPWASQWTSCAAISTFISHLPPPPLPLPLPIPPFFFFCHFNHIPPGQSATGRARLCAAVFVRVRYLWLTNGCHHDSP